MYSIIMNETGALLLETAALYQIPIKKVISLSYPYTDHLLALGVTPAAGQLQESFDRRIKELTLPYHASEPWDIQRQFF